MKSSGLTDSENFNDFITEFPQLKNSFKELLDAHYNTNIFKGEQTKKEFPEPDILPFDDLNASSDKK